MLRITFQEKDKNPAYLAKRIYLMWEHGTKLDGSPSEYDWQIVSLEASEKELSWIGQNFSHIPSANVVNHPIQTWKGIFAEFIYDHLPR